VKNKLLFTILFFTLFISFCSSEPSQEEIQEQIDTAVEQAVEEALSTTSDEYTDKTDETTTTMQPVLAVPVGNYWGQYNDGTWAIVLSSEKPENFEWAWDVFNREDPSGYYGYDEFDENSTLIGTLVDFDCSFNRISKTEEHKEAFGVFETTIEYYDTYFDWAEDNYDYLTEEAVLTISKIMRGVWTCDYEYLESISTEYLDFVNSGDAYAEVPKFSDYIASFENNYDDDHRYGKYTYTLGALLYMTPSEESWNMPESSPCTFLNDTQYVGKSPGIIWPLESKNPKQLRQIQVNKMSMFDNGITKSLIDGTYQGDDGSYGYRLKISSDGVWYSYKFTGHTWRSDYATSIPAVECLASLEDIEMQDKTNAARSSDTAVEGEVNSFQKSSYFFKQDFSTIITNVRIQKGTKFDSLVIEFEKQNENDLLPGGYSIERGVEISLYEGGYYQIPSDFNDHLVIRINMANFYDSNRDKPTWIRNWDRSDLITSEDSNLVAKFGNSGQPSYFFLLKIDPASTFRSYRTANPPSLVIEVEK
jgi:hypothetical protein